MRKTFIMAALLLCTVSLCRLAAYVWAGDDLEKSYAKIAKEYGCLEALTQGNAVLRKLSALSVDERKKLDIGAHRKDRLAFVGSGAPPGASNDLLTADGYYVRIVNEDGKDLRPHSTLWDVLVCGTVLQVLPQNQIIVLEVNEKDWHVLATW